MERVRLVNRFGAWVGVAGLLAAAALTGGAAVASTSAVVDDDDDAPSASQQQDQLSTIRLTGIVRDFRAAGVTPGGHPDFESYNTNHVVGLARDTLDADGKPVYTGGPGRLVNTQCKDRLGRNINPAFYDRSLGDSAPAFGTPSRAVTSAASFAQWWRDVPGVNMSKPHTIELRRREGTNIFAFHEQDADTTSQREGFFPADGELFNDTNPTYGHNYHFTFELDTNFRYRRGTGQVFTFVGDDDVFVFIDNKLAIDVGGVHGAVSQTIDLDRFANRHGLQDGQKYSLKFFFAERRTTRSNCRIETTLELENAQLPTVSGLYD